MTNADFRKVIDACMKRHGVELYGFCPFNETLPLIECRAKARLPETCGTVIVCAFPYLVREKSSRNLSYYACVADYHYVVTKILSDIASELVLITGEEFEVFTDNSPIREVNAAVKSGIGVLGDNGLLITEKYGSYVFLGEIVTNIEIDCEIHGGSCLHCGMCIKKCPSSALENSSVNEAVCLSAVTQRKGELSQNEIMLIRQNGLVWGCDSCQTVCPMNRNVHETYISEFINSAHHFLLSDEVGERIKKSAYNWRGKKTILRNTALFENW